MMTFNPKSEVHILYKEEVIQNGIKNLAEDLNKIYKDEEIYLVCVLKGSAMFMTDLAKRLRMPVKMEFVRLSSYGSGTKSSGKVNPVEISLPDLNNNNVIIVEDIIDTGCTLKFLTEYLIKNFKMKSMKICTLLNKRVLRVEQVEPDYYLFEADDKFIVGYGLDYDGYYRNLPYIGYIET